MDQTYRDARRASPRPGGSSTSSPSSSSCSLYALWPVATSEQFDEAARIPLRED